MRFFANFKHNRKRSARRARQHRRRFHKFFVEQLESRVFMAADVGSAVTFGDFNGDGYADMAVGALYDSEAASNAGAVNVIYGSAGGLTPVGDQLWHQDSGGVRDSAEQGDHFGATLAVGDFDNDGYDDLAIGVPGEDVGHIKDAGAVNVLYGSAAGLGPAGDQFFHQDTPGIMDSAEAFDRFGSVLSTGDFDNDGYDDLAIGVPHENIDNQQDAGVVHILYGSYPGLKTSNNQYLHQDNGAGLDSAERYDFFGAALASGDFNNDNRDDLAIGVPGEDNDTAALYDVGAVSVHFGTSIGFTGIERFFTQDNTGGPGSEDTRDNFGSALAAGDFDGDDFDDLAIGSPNEDLGVSNKKDAGTIHVMYGKGGLTYNFDLSKTQLWHQDSLDIKGSAETNDHFGAVLVAGDFNASGRDDLAIGVPGEGVGNVTDAGAVHIMYGTSYAGLRPYGNRIYYQGYAGVAGMPEAYDYFGSALAAGDSNGDGSADLAIGVGGEGIAWTSDTGTVQLLQGKTNTYGLRTDNDTLWHQNVSGIKGSSSTGDSFGGQAPPSMTGDVPRLESNPGASKPLYLDFNGGWSDKEYTPEFNLDGYRGFNRTERALIEDIWAHVAEDFAPFDINVTTKGQPLGAFRVLIGGNGKNRQDNPTTGWGPGDFNDYATTNNDVYVYSNTIQSTWNDYRDRSLAAWIGTTVSHESGHGFGLDHKGTYNKMGDSWNLADEYSAGGSNWTPIMGNNLSSDRTIWTENIVTIGFGKQVKGNNDFAHLVSKIGLRSDDHSSSLAWATNLGTTGTTGYKELFGRTGIIESINDEDTFRLVVTAGGLHNIELRVADVGANLRASLELRDSSGTMIEYVPLSNPTLGASISSYLAPGTYYVTAGSMGIFTGDVGQYALRVEYTPLFSYVVGAGSQGKQSFGITSQMAFPTEQSAASYSRDTASIQGMTFHRDQPAEPRRLLERNAMVAPSNKAASQFNERPVSPTANSGGANPRVAETDWPFHEIGREQLPNGEQPMLVCDRSQEPLTGPRGKHSVKRSIRRAS